MERFSQFTHSELSMKLLNSILIKGNIIRKYIMPLFLSKNLSLNTWSIFLLTFSDEYSTNSTNPRGKKSSMHCHCYLLTREVAARFVQSLGPCLMTWGSRTPWFEGQASITEIVIAFLVESYITIHTLSSLWVKYTIHYILNE